MVSEFVSGPVEEEPERPTLIFVYGRTSGPSRKAEAFLAQVLQKRR